MPRMPGTTWAGEQSPRTPMIRYDIVCVHTIVGYAPAHAAHFSVKADGTIIQSRDTAYRSAANLNGNHRIIAIENEDHGPAFGGTPRLPGWVALTDAQVDANARILAWANKTHGVPLQLCPDSRPGSRGLGYHRQGIDGNFAGYRFPGRVSGGEVWTSSYGKVCPTDARIAQLPTILATARGATTQEDYMATDAAEQLLKTIDAKADRLLAGQDAEAARDAADRDRAKKAAARIRERVNGGRGQVADLQADVADLSAALGLD